MPERFLSGFFARMPGQKGVMLYAKEGETMQFALLIVLLAALGAGLKRIVFLRRCGFFPAAQRLYGRLAWCVGLTAWSAMAVQEAVLFFSRQLTWGNALPLHLCSLTGVLTLPMLLSRRPLLRHVSLYLGLPGALLAIAFPAVLPTPWPRLTETAFHLLHCMVALAPLLPLSLGLYPKPSGAAWAGLFLMVHGLCALGVNALTGGNYLFLSLPAAGTPLAALAASGLAAYRLLLALLAFAVLALEALIVFLCTKKRG